jgi:hypothetical protein
VAEAIAPTWGRRRAEIEGVATPLREWLISELAPRPGQTIHELASGAGDTRSEVSVRSLFRWVLPRDRVHHTVLVRPE